MPTKTELEAAYRATTYRVFLPDGVVELRIDVAHPAFAAWLAAQGVERWAIITAFNPHSEPRPAAENLERQATLEIALLEDGYEPYVAENAADDDAWPGEDSCFVAGIDLAEAMALASRFGQNAIVFGEAAGLPRLAWIEHKE